MWIAQTANILLYLGAREGLAPKAEAGRLWAHQLQLTIADFVVQIHDTHHPLGGALYYEEQKPEAKRHAANFRKNRAPKFLGYFDKVIGKSGGPFLLGRRLTYPDLSLFQVVDGLRYAFPKMMQRLERTVPRVVEVHARVAQAPAYRGVSRVGAAHSVQRDGDLPALSGAGRVTRAPQLAHGEERRAATRLEPWAAASGASIGRPRPSRRSSYAAR